MLDWNNLDEVLLKKLNECQEELVKLEMKMTELIDDDLLTSEDLDELMKFRYEQADYIVNEWFPKHLESEKNLLEKIKELKTKRYRESLDQD